MITLLILLVDIYLFILDFYIDLSNAYVFALYMYIIFPIMLDYDPNV